MKNIYGEQGQYLGQVNEGQTYSSATGYTLEEIKEIDRIQRELYSLKQLKSK